MLHPLYPPSLYLTTVHPYDVYIPSSLPATYLTADLPNLNQRTLLPTFSIPSSASASTPRSLPTNPVILDGFDLPCPAKVISALKNNWTVHIPITALTMRTIATASFTAQEDVGHALLFKEGQLTVSSSKFSSKDEGSITAQEWFHAFPRLTNAIRRYLPGDQAGQIADAWEAHFNRLVRRADFWEMFHIVLCYDIRLRIHFVNPKCGIDPSVWQEDVWHQIVDAYHNNTQHLLPGLAGIPPPKAPSQSFPTPASTTTSSSSSTRLSASSVQPRPFQSQPGTSSRPSASSSQAFRCLFCGDRPAASAR
ncbi:hypothetical protein JVT61DRAFT_4834 [Boletus reticuloceps]|uniref:Uncharacterized protein n=1 Tax=Boletus reticuloceps TaxID=495285 RepID=A0A8I3A8S9_9AGAM|nr:hypothetical protein JVT61DRAFT_4834 [Boletus reticuloceps]